MSRFLVHPNNISADLVSLKEKEAHHLKNVLRFCVGDKVVVFDGVGNEYRCQIRSLNKKECLLQILEKLKSPSKKSFVVTLAHTVTRGERFDWVVEKATELGVTSILPFSCERMSVKLNGTQVVKKRERWQRLAEAASKQCGRAQLPEVSQIIKLPELIAQFANYELVLLAYELEVGKTIKTTLRSAIKDKRDLSVLAVVGPEGGFSAAEADQMVRAGAQSVSLGENILRTETAAISMLAMIFYELMS